MRKRLFLIDGASYAYRSFYAIRNLSTSKGFPTNAIFGFLKSMKKLIDDFSPEYLIVTFDSKGPTFRHEKFKDYKIHRKPMPEELAEQLPGIKRVCAVMGVPLVAKQGYEADDLMATLGAKGAAEGLEVFIATGDKDMLQIVDENIKVLHTHRENAIMDVAAVREKYGIDPAQIIDMLALAGDAADNIPGIPGIGDKTALSLVKEFHDVEGVLGNVEKISGARRKENILENAGAARMSRELVVLDSNVPVELDLEGAKMSGPDTDELVKLYREFEFKGLLKSILPAQERKTDYTTLLTEEMIGEIERKIVEQEIALSLIVSGDDSMTCELRGFGVCVEEGSACYVAFDDGEGREMDLLKRIVGSKGVRLAGHDLKSSIIVLRRLGIEVECEMVDVEVAAYLLRPEGNYGVDKLAQKYLDATPQYIPKFGEAKKKRVRLVELESELISNAACEMADFILALMHKLSGELDEKDLARLFHDVEMPLVRVLADMEYQGVKIDRDFLADMSVEFKKKIDRLELKIYDIAGGAFNINSPKQLAGVLFTRLGLPVHKKTKTGPSTNVEVLKKLALIHPLPSEIMEFRQLTKLKSTYIDALPELINVGSGRVHTSFNQTVTSTGRLSSSIPNLQNIPVRTEAGRRIRQAFVPSEDGWSLISADYSQIELRIFAHLAGEQNMIDAFGRGEDIHAYTASLVWDVEQDKVTKEMRGRAKAVNFGIIYGQQAFGLAANLGIDVREAADFIDQYYARYPGIKEYMDRTIEQASEQGWVGTIMNRRRYIPELKSRNGNTAALGRRTAVNAPIQGSAADIIKVAMINIQRRLAEGRFKSRMILQIHDELVFESPQDEVERMSRLAVAEMESVVQLKVPLRVDCNVGGNWMEIK
jgi:DNA polymerase I